MNHIRQEVELPSECDLLVLYNLFLRNLLLQQQQQQPQNKTTIAVRSSVFQSIRPSNQKEKHFQQLLPYASTNPSLHGCVDLADQSSSSSSSLHAAYEPCSSQCGFFVSSDLFPSAHVCLSSGNLHYCTTVTCTFLVTSRYEMTCLLTGLTYPLEEVSVGPGHNDHFDSSLKSRVSMHTKTNKKNKRKIHEEEEEEGEEAKRTKKQHQQLHVTRASRKPVRMHHFLPSPPPVTTTVKKQHQQHFEQERQTIQNTILSLIPKTEHSVIHDEMVAFAYQAVAFWQKVIQTHYYHSVKNKFKLKVFVTVFLYASMKGIQVSERDPMLGRFQHLYALLPASRKLKEILKAQRFRCAQFTDCSTYLNEIIREMKLTVDRKRS